MRNIKIEKVTLNIGTGKDPAKLEKGLKLLEAITGKKPVKTFTNKRIPNWGIRPGLAIGCKVTLRKKHAYQMLRSMLQAKDNLLSEKQFDNNGNLAFGIHEYIDIPSVKYNPEIGIMGLEVCVTLERPGFRIKRRKIKNSKIGTKHHIDKKEAIEFMKKELNVRIEK